MSVMLTSSFVTSLPVTDDGAYLVAKTPTGLIIGSQLIDGINQTSLALWGDDAQTSEIDGATAGELIGFQLINGTELYDLSMPNSVAYVTNGLVVQASPGTYTLVDCGSTVLGCMDASADNYNPSATEDDNSCMYTVFGCMDSSANNYNALATEDDNSCMYTVMGCTDPTAFNYNLLANTDDGSCLEVVEGCIDMLACNYNDTANTDDGTCYSELEVTVQMVDVLLEYTLTTIVSPEISDLSYTWTLDGTVLSNELSSLDVSENGNYTVTVSDGTCTATESITVVGIGLLELENNAITLYPNPALDVLNINFEVALADLQLQVLNTMGAEVLSRRINRSEVGEEVTVHIADLPKGMYILKVYSNDFTRSIPWIKR